MGELGEEEVFAYQEAALRSMADAYAGPMLIYRPRGRMTGRPHQAVARFAGDAERVRLYESGLDLDDAGGLFPDGSHPNVSGHGMIAEDLLSHLTAEKIIPYTEL